MRYIFCQKSRGDFKYYFADFVRKRGGGGTPQIRKSLFAEKKSVKGGRGVPPKSVTYFLDQNQVFFWAKNTICSTFWRKNFGEKFLKGGGVPISLKFGSLFLSSLVPISLFHIVCSPFFLNLSNNLKRGDWLWYIKMLWINDHGFMKPQFIYEAYEQWSLMINDHSWRYDHWSSTINDHDLRLWTLIVMIIDHADSYMNVLFILW